MNDARQQIVDSIRNNSNILVTVSTNPSVDELSAALGLTVLLNKMDRRATAVFSGAVPPAIEFLEPGKTFENTADSLRDFIIALDKEKADHLRYKVDGDVVKIFITPYRTTLSQSDLEFSQGDYNVELVIGLGVTDQQHLDKALEAHGKILHDATVVTVTAGDNTSNLGSVDWHKSDASSLSEMVTDLAEAMKDDSTLLDDQIATALLTGIVSATDRFSNNHTTSGVMTMAAQLMAAGANQQLIAAKLEAAHDIGPTATATDEPQNAPAEIPKEQSNELVINRSDDAPKPEATPAEKPVDLQPIEAQQAPSKPSNETLDQLELEKQLAGVTAAPTGTMESIEKELEQETNKQEGAAPEPSQPDLPPLEPLTAPSDSMMPGFEPTGFDIPPLAEPRISKFADELPAQPSLEPQPSAPPEIVNDHGSFTETLPEQTQPLNSIQGNPNEGEAASVDPFSSLQPQVAATVAPSKDGGTAEGAALLAADDDDSSIGFIPPLDNADFNQIESSGIPDLPPLPPLPPDMDLPPLPPPPPPPPSFGQTPMPSGAVSGDVFGDGKDDEPAMQTVVPSAPPEPGQFRIPGQ